MICGVMSRILDTPWSCCGLALALVAALGCQPDGLSHERAPSPVRELPVLWQKWGAHSRLNQGVRIVARDAGTLAQIPITEVPVDFESQMVLIAGLGPMPTDEVGIRIKRVWQEGSVIRVQERYVHPGTTAEEGLRPSSPWTIVVVPRSDANVEGYVPRVPRGVLDDEFR